MHMARVRVLEPTRWRRWVLALDSWGDPARVPACGRNAAAAAPAQDHAAAAAGNSDRPTVIETVTTVTILVSGV